jgi:multimeric flavodoxin WrbA
MKTRIVPLALALALAGTGLLAAQEAPTPPEHRCKHGMAPHDCGAMTDDMMAGCKAMMEKRQAVRDQTQAMEAKLDALVATMQTARGNQKIDALAAVVTELVAQRKVMHSTMESMQPSMMEHHMRHLQMGMMRMMGAAGGCPMMKAHDDHEGTEKEPAVHPH